MCPLCLMSLALTVTATTGVGAAAIAAATRAAKSLAHHPPEEASSPQPADRTEEVGAHQ